MPDRAWIRGHELASDRSEGDGAWRQLGGSMADRDNACRRLQVVSVLLLFGALGCDSATTPVTGGADVSAIEEISFFDLGSLDTVAEVAPVVDVVTEPDVAADIASPADLVKVDAGCTEAACPCTENASCDSGFCIETAGGQQCAKSCTAACAEGFKCSQVTGSGGDIINLCVPTHPRLCEPCGADSDCNNVLGGADSRCVPYKDATGSTVGQFCGNSCGEKNSCGSGYSCKEATSLGGVKGNQCIKDDLVCPCDGRAIKMQLATLCSNANSAGTCGGKRACGENGLSACDAPSAVAEQCNLKDDDCDGQTDEPSTGMCVDGKFCTYDNCIAGACQHPPQTGPCDDGSACSSGDKCSDGDCVGVAVVCDDKIVCTADVCDPLKGCTFGPDDNAACNDGNVCSVGDACKGGVCLSGAATVCDDSNPCTTDSCDSKAGCAFIANALPCNDGDGCSLGDACKGGACTPTGKLPCNDGNPCTDDSCDGKLGCVFTPNTLPCTDSNVCTEGDVCKDGACGITGFKSCDDGKGCTNDGCDPKSGCVFSNNTAACNDGSACTEGDVCKDGSCAGGLSVDCDDGNPCTSDNCVKASGCVHSASTSPCDDGNVCTLSDTCSAGKCVPGKGKVCNDSNPCSDDSCDSVQGCVTTDNSAACSDGNACTTNDACKGGACAGGSAPVCDDGNACSDDACDKTSGCTHLANTGVCSDGNVCTLNDACKSAACTAGTAKNCDDDNPCTTDSCDAVKGCVSVNNSAPCSDGSVCTESDTCGGGVCAPGAAKVCNDGNPCTADVCDATKGCQQPLAVDNSPCGDGICKGGSCTCASGYVGTGANCTDIDECLKNNGGCNTNASCTNSVGSFKCACKNGYVGDGLTCNTKCGDGVKAGAEECDDGNLNSGDGCDAGCKLDNLVCKGGTTASIAPSKKAVACINNASCEQNKNSDCPGGFHLCTHLEFNAYNDGWSYSTPGQPVGAISCRKSGGAGHLTIGNTQLGSDNSSANCGHGSSNSWCSTSYGCNEKSDVAVCCVDSTNCGNGKIDAYETCDDGNKTNGDGCDSNCEQTSPGWCS